MLPLVAGGLASLGGGLLGGLFGGSDPKYKAPALDQDTILNQKLLADRANRSQQDFSNIETQGIEAKHGGLLGSNEMGGYGSDDALGGVSPHEMSSALQSRSQKLYGDDVARIGRQANINAVGDKFAAQKTNRNMADKHANIENAIKNQVEAMELAHTEARNKVFSSLFGNAGSMIGQGMASKKEVESQGGSKGSGVGGATGHSMGRQE